MSKEKRQKVVCPKCGGRLLFDELYQVSYIQKINLDGTLSNRVRKECVGPEDFAYIRCCACDFCLGPDEYDFADERVILNPEDIPQEDEEA